MFNHLITHSLFYAAIFNGYIFVIMTTTSPRIWGYNDYPDVIKNKVPPRTKREKVTAMILGFPWLIFVFIFPIFSTCILKCKLDVSFTFLKAFLNLYSMFVFASVVDLVILDWLIISKITPKFVIIPGSEEEDYKDFSHHYKSHVKAMIVLIPICFIIAGIVLLV